MKASGFSLCFSAVASDHRTLATAATILGLPGMTGNAKASIRLAQREECQPVDLQVIDLSPTGGAKATCESKWLFLLILEKCIDFLKKLLTNWLTCDIISKSRGTKPLRNK